MGATNEADEMALIDEAMSEADQDIAEGKELLSGTETETEDTQVQNMIHSDSQLPTVEHTYNLQRRRNMQPDYTNIYRLQATITHCALTQLSMKCGLNKFKQTANKAVTEELEQLHRRDKFLPVRTEKLSKKKKHNSLALIMF